MTNEESLLARATERLAKDNVDVDALAVVAIGSEQLVGELQKECFDDGVWTVELKNPRRLLRLQQMQKDNFRIDFLLIDLDLVQSGTVRVSPNVMYKVADLDTVSRARMAALYAQYLDTKEKARLAASGIVTPEMQVPGDIAGPNGKVSRIR